MAKRNGRLAIFAAICAAVIAFVAAGHAASHAPGHGVSCAICESPADDATPSVAAAPLHSPPVDAPVAISVAPALVAVDAPNARGPPVG